MSGLGGYSSDTSFAGASWGPFGSGDALAVKVWTKQLQEDAAKEGVFASLLPKTPIKPVAPHIRLMWRLEQVWQDYRRELHDYLFPEFVEFDQGAY